jgi:hypothetical protein
MLALSFREGRADRQEIAHLPLRCSAMKAMWVLAMVFLAACGGKTPMGGGDVVLATDIPLVETSDTSTDFAFDSTPSDCIADILDVSEVVGPCLPDCEGAECGPDGCGGFCGVCDESSGFFCEDRLCTCQPDCPYLSCGIDDGCGGTCQCPTSSYSCLDEACIILDVCGNDLCEEGEDPCSCPTDCLWGPGGPGDPCCSLGDCSALLCVPC